MHCPADVYKFDIDGATFLNVPIVMRNHVDVTRNIHYHVKNRVVFSHFGEEPSRKLILSTEITSNA
jgi:hypothetical protein